MNTIVLAVAIALCAMCTEARFVPQEESDYVHPHIIRGRDAYVGEFPWQGSLQRTGTRKYNGHTCGCVIISYQWVVTAGHCVGAGISGLYVVLGLHNRADPSAGDPKDYLISQIVVHPGWTGQIGTTDAALIRLRESILPGRLRRPILMARERDDFDYQTCTITGWGVTREGLGSPATVLQAADLEVMPNAECQRSFSIVNEGHICVGGRSGPGSCNGDSGGPLVCGGKLAGVTSFGIRGCYTFYPSVYTRIGYVRSWIDSIVN